MKKIIFAVCVLALSFPLSAPPVVAQSSRTTPDAQTQAVSDLVQLYRQQAIYAVLLDDDEGMRNALLKHSASHPIVQRLLDWTKQYDHNARALPQSPLPGSISSFYVSFPFECASILDFARPLTPEQRGFDTSKATPGAMMPALNWMRYTSVGNMSAILPQEALHNPGFAAVYLTTRLRVAQATDAYIEIPSVNPVIAWMDNQRVVENLKNGPAQLPLYADRYKIHLDAGDHILTIKTAAFERQPELYVFLTDGAGKPLNVTVHNDDPIVSAPLGESLNAQKINAVYTSYLQDTSASPASLSLLSRHMLGEDDASRAVNNLLFSDVEKTAALSLPDLEIAVIALDDPGKSLQILDKARAHYDKNPRFELLYARQLILNSEAQGDTGSRFADEWQNIKTHLSSPLAPFDGVSYEPLRLKLLALAELNTQQVLTLQKQMDVKANHAYTPSLLPLIAGHLESRGKMVDYRRVLDQLYETQKHSAIYLVDRLDLDLRRAASSREDQTLALTLSDIQKQVESFFKLHPYDDYVWQFWLDIVSNYGLDNEAIPKKTRDIYKQANFTANADEWFMLYLTQRMNDPARWQRYAEYAVKRQQTTEAAAAYDMIAQLRPQDETAAQRASTLKRFSAQDDGASSQNETAFETPYIIENIPTNTPPDAAQIVSLLDHRVVRILPNGLSATFSQIAFKIMDEQGLKMVRALPVNYAPNDEKLEIISVITTKKDGSVRRLYNTTEYNTADESIRMYYDQRQLVIEVPDLSVGDVLEFRFKRTQMQRQASSTPYFSDIYQLQTHFNRNWSRYTVIAPENLPVRLLRSDLAHTSQFVGTTTKEGNNTVTVYEERNTPRIIPESQMPGLTQVLPFLLASSFQTWQDVADWFIDLAKPQWEPDKAIKDAVRELTQNIEDPFEKLKKIHAFVLKSTRYVALEFGIHGHKPYPVAQVFERRFGDCKDKASLLKVMLDLAGIPANFVLIRTRQNGNIDMTLPNAYLFDHAIVYVPQFDLFLDGTAEFSGTGELPALDQEAWALIIQDDAQYTLRKTPATTPADNLVEHQWTFDLSQGERVVYTDKAFYKGLMAPSYRERYQVESLRQERLQSEYAYIIPGTTVHSAHFSDLTDLEQDVSFEVAADTSLTQMVKKDQNAWLIRPGITTSNMATVYAPSATRTFPLIQAVAMTQRANITLVLPDHARAILPPPQSETSKHGAWRVYAEQSGNQIRIDYEITLSETSIAPEHYHAYQNFLMRFDRALNTQYRIETDAKE